MILCTRAEHLAQLLFPHSHRRHGFGIGACLTIPGTGDCQAKQTQRLCLAIWQAHVRECLCREARDGALSLVWVIDHALSSTSRSIRVAGVRREIAEAIKAIAGFDQTERTGPVGRLISRQC
jgi:hypothetical protein